MSLNTHNLFVSHSWAYGDAYEKLVGLLKERPYYNFKNYSVPKSNPIVGATSDPKLEAAIEAKMRLSTVIIIMAGKYSTYSKWINIEIKIAKKLGKPIVAIKPWGATQISSVVRNAAHAEAAWNTDSIVKAIRSVV
ncbi:TIR domain-containing protein [Colwellia sp. UCD-KL20]|uniref:TIR domain-containing protein n=1 Tax=Colwellia sp. UCD-KL20 TaxID=1917165 RepID=UPI0009710F74|nr:TIR domain-containing protein [Colwellia sp. UCD-KL20]